MMYQGRINNRLKKDSSIVEELGEDDAYVFEEDFSEDDKGLLKCINEVMDFWSLPNLSELPKEIKKYNSIKEAIKDNKDKHVVIYQDKGDK
jgi:hypothetical protein